LCLLKNVKFSNLQNGFKRLESLLLWQAHLRFMATGPSNPATSVWSSLSLLGSRRIINYPFRGFNLFQLIWWSDFLPFSIFCFFWSFFVAASLAIIHGGHWLLCWLVCSGLDWYILGSNCDGFVVLVSFKI
jgi:hypothetical protein